MSTDFHQLENLNRPYISLDENLSVEQEAKYTKKVVLSADDAKEGLYLHPGEFVLASTLEYFRFPDDLAGRIEGRSSWGRLGLLVHATAGFVDPGYAGALTFELSNVGRLPIELKPRPETRTGLLFPHVSTEFDSVRKEASGEVLGRSGGSGESGTCRS